ncbi:MAG: DUF4124 domain-containing protein [Steroidobacteraceae bacterium]
MLCASAAAGATTVYKWVDAQGVTHYSDQPYPGAVKLEVGSIQTYSGRRTSTAASRSAPAADANAPPYAVCELYKPSSEEVFFNTQTVTAKLRVQPALRAGDQLFLALDGRRLPDQPSGTEVTITPVFRGTHTLMLVVEDRRGTTVCQSDPVTFHIRQPSAQAPNPANRPRF